MQCVPGLDLEAVDQPAPQIADHRLVGIGIQVAVAFEAVEQYLQALPEVTGAEVLVAVLRNSLLQQLIGRGIAHLAQRSFTRPG